MPCQRQRPDYNPLWEAASRQTQPSFPWCGRRPRISRDKIHACDSSGCGKTFYERCTLLRHQSLKHGRKTRRDVARRSMNNAPCSDTRVWSTDARPSIRGPRRTLRYWRRRCMAIHSDWEHLRRTLRHGLTYRLRCRMMGDRALLTSSLYGDAFI